MRIKLLALSTLLLAGTLVMAANARPHAALQPYLTYGMLPGLVMKLSEEQRQVTERYNLSTTTDTIARNTINSSTGMSIYSR